MDMLGIHLLYVLCGALFMYFSPTEGVCRRNGVFYETGESVPASRCRPCACNRGGRIYCRRLRCPRRNCIGARVIPGHCCPTCPSITIETFKRWNYTPTRYNVMRDREDEQGQGREDDDSGSAERSRDWPQSVFSRAQRHRASRLRHRTIAMRRVRPSPRRRMLYNYLYNRHKN